MKTEALKSNRFLIFLNERFPLSSYIPLIVVFTLSTALFVEHQFFQKWSLKSILFMMFASTLFFLKLRFYDEIKDYQTDLKINPTRPLPRGLVTHKEVFLGILLCILLEVGLFFFISPPSILALLLAISYSLLMFKEFFIGKILKNHLTTYAVSHTFVCSLLTLALVVAFSYTYPREFPIPAWWYILSRWPLFNLFEFGRKSFAVSEEKSNVPSYTKNFGQFGAGLLSLSQLGLYAFCLYQIPLFIAPIPLNTIGIMLILFSLLVSFFALVKGEKSKFVAAVYRNVCNLFIMLALIGEVLYLFLKRG